MQKIKNYFKTLAESDKFNKFAYRFVIVIIALLIFQAGEYVGFHKANFSYKWGDNYQKFFEMRGRGDKVGGFEKIFENDQRKKSGPVGSFFDAMPIRLMPEFMGAHGVTGKIIDIKFPSIVISSADNIEKAVLVASSTLIRAFRNGITASELKINDDVIVVGSPNENAEIVARMIRLLPSNSELIKSSTSTNKQ